MVRSSGYFCDINLVSCNDVGVAIRSSGYMLIDKLLPKFWDRYRRTGDIADLEIAIQRLQESLHMTPDNHPDRARRLQDLATGHNNRYRRTGDIADLQTAIQRLQEAVSHSSSSTLVRLRSGKTLLALHVEVENWSLAYQSASITLSLIPLLTPHSLENSDKQHWLTDIVGLASDAAAVALTAGKTQYEAIRLLELGRGIIAGSLNELRADISDLQQNHPKLAQEYIDLRDRLDAPTSSTRLDQPEELMTRTRQVNWRYNTGQKLEQSIQTIRGLPGFDRFLMAPPEDELKAAAASGLIVIINVSDYRCDALIIEKHEIRILPLPWLHNRDIRTRVATLAKPDSRLLEWL